MQTKMYLPVQIGTELGSHIWRRRKELRLTQARLAQMASVSQQTVSKIENQCTNVGLDTLAEIARMLGLTVRLVAEPRSGPVSLNLLVSMFECSHCGHSFLSTDAEWCPKCGFEGHVTKGMFPEYLVITL